MKMSAVRTAARLILVARSHLCRPRQAVTKPVTKSGGRPPIGEKAMTGAERMRKLRAGRRALTRTVWAITLLCPLLHYFPVTLGMVGFCSACDRDDVSFRRLRTLRGSGLLPLTFCHEASPRGAFQWLTV